MGQRARTPAPSSSTSSSTPYRTTRLPSSSSAYSSILNGGGGGSGSRQSSVERELYTTPLPSYGGAGAPSSSSYRISDLSSTVRSRQSSPLRSYETSAAYRTLNFGTGSGSSSYGGYGSGGGYSSSSISGLPPAYDSYRNRREASTERALSSLRNRREASQERSYRPSTASSSYLKTRRSSFVDNTPFKYYY